MKKLIVKNNNNDSVFVIISHKEQFGKNHETILGKIMKQPE